MEGFGLLAQANPVESLAERLELLVAELIKLAVVSKFVEGRTGSRSEKLLKYLLHNFRSDEFCLPAAFEL